MSTETTVNSSFKIRDVIFEDEVKMFLSESEMTTYGKPANLLEKLHRITSWINCSSRNSSSS